MSTKMSWADIKDDEEQNNNDEYINVNGVSNKKEDKITNNKIQETSTKT
jgi:hypothetical protein